MKPDQFKNSLAVIMPLMFSVACSGGSGDSASSTPDAGAANPASPSSEQLITGRVADGYLQGAIVCIDINENGQCDPDEPQVESGAGGSYSLDVPNGAAGSPVLAEVPATAIDEDTGLPIGKELVLSTPGDKPEFVSPITTLVHQELKNNPNLNTDDAAAAVMETLGLPDEQDASLFTDYIANSDVADEQRREKFEFLHQTARVVASMMDEIHGDVEAAATAQGIDVDSQETAAVIRDLVRKEIRTQLPDISAAVAQRILQIEEAAEAGNGQVVELTDEFDPDSIKDSLDETDLITDIAVKIEAVKHEAPIELAKIDELLAAGIYIIDMDCERLDEYGPEDGLVKPAVEKPAVMLSDEGVPQVVHMPEFCTAEYTHITTETIEESAADGTVNATMTAEGDMPANANLIVTHYYYGFDETSGRQGWIMNAETREDHPHLLTLVNGDWIPVQHEGPYGVVEFTADGGAVMNTDEGKLLVYASSRDLSGKSVLHHIFNRGANSDLLDRVDESDIFPETSSVHKLHIRRNASLIVMFNWYPETDDAGVDQCAEFAGNCNVVYVKDDASYSSTPLADLGDLYDGSVIDAVAHDNKEHLQVDVALHVKVADGGVTADSAVPVDTGNTTEDRPSGIATWTVSSPLYGIELSPGTDSYPANGPIPTEPHDCKGELGYGPDGVELNAQHIDEASVTELYCLPQVELVQMVCTDANQDWITIMVPRDHPEYVADAQYAIKENQGLTVTGEEATIPDCPLLPADTLKSVAQNDVATDGKGSVHSQSIVIGESRWRTVSVQGIDMIVIDVPVSVRHRTDEDEMAELLLIQDGEFVRRGARIGERSVDDETAYSEAAFDTLLPVIVEYVKPISE